MRECFYYSEDFKVYDRFNSHNHLSEDLYQLISYVIKLYKKDIIGKDFIKLSHSFSYIIGKSTCVEVDEYDKIIYAKRKFRYGYSKFVLDREPEDCNNLIVILKRVSQDEYILITSFVGYLSEPEPWDKNATGNSINFWNNHALILNELSIKEIEGDIIPELLYLKESLYYAC